MVPNIDSSDIQLHSRFTLTSTQTACKCAVGLSFYALPRGEVRPPIDFVGITPATERGARAICNPPYPVLKSGHAINLRCGPPPSLCPTSPSRRVRPLDAPHEST